MLYCLKPTCRCYYFYPQNHHRLWNNDIYWHWPLICWQLRTVYGVQLFSLLAVCALQFYNPMILAGLTISFILAAILIMFIQVRYVIMTISLNLYMYMYHFTSVCEWFINRRYSRYGNKLLTQIKQKGRVYLF